MGKKSNDEDNWQFPLVHIRRFPGGPDVLDYRVPLLHHHHRHSLWGAADEIRHIRPLAFWQEGGGWRKHDGMPEHLFQCPLVDLSDAMLYKS